MKKITLSFCALIFCLTIHAGTPRELTMEKIWKKGTFSQKYVSGLKSMKDGEFYTVLETVEGIQQINKYSYEKEKAIGTLLFNDLKNDKGETLDIEGYELSNDETKILIQTESELIYRHSMRSAYYMFDIATKKLNRIAGDKFQLASFSPDGKYISYVKENNLYLYDLLNKKEKAVTTDGKKNSIINGAPDWVYEEEFTLVKAYDWSADSKCLAYYRFDESRVKEFSFPMYGSLYPENYIYKYPKAGEENARVSVLMYHVETGKLVPVVASVAYEYIPRIQWLPVGDKLSIQFMNREQNAVYLDLADRNTGRCFNLYQEQSETYLEVQDVYFLRKKSAFLWLSERNNYNHIYYFEFDEKLFNDDGTSGVTSKLVLNEGEDVVTNIIGLNEETNTLYYTFCDKYNPTDRLTMVKPLDPQPRFPMMPMPIPSGSTMVEASEGFKFFVIYSTSVNQPLMVAIHNKEGHPVRVIEENRALIDTLQNYKLSPKKFFKFKNRNGDELVGWTILPADFNPVKKYPVLMYVYGGPGSQTVLNAWGGSNDMWFQYLAQKGYIVASVDNRGTGGRTRSFRTCTYGQLGKLETEDQIDAAIYFTRFNYVDEKRIGIWGWSYGGYMSTLCLAKGADVFKMAIAVAPVTNWRYYDSIYTERYMGLPDKNGKSYDENSPVNHVDKIKGKYLLVHGTADDNVHFQNSAELVKALVDKNVQFDMMAYPDKNHSIYGGNTRYHLYTKMTDFIFENL